MHKLSSWTGSLAGALPWDGILAGSFPWVAIASSVGSPLLNTRQSVVEDSVTDKLVSAGSNCRLFDRSSVTTFRKYFHNTPNYVQ